MKRPMIGSVVAAGVFLAGCGERPTKQEFLARELNALESYCTADAMTAHDALRVSVVYIEKCRKLGVQGILYDEVLARSYGRLYLVERHLGHSADAEECLRKYMQILAVSNSRATVERGGRSSLEHLVAERVDGDLHASWKSTNTPLSKEVVSSR
jgi:hypothetical protein